MVQLGNFRYAKAFGHQSLKPGQPQEPLRTDSIFWTASCTKLQTTVAALQCVEKGLLKLDDDATQILHEFKDIKVLREFDVDTNEPIFEELNRKLTLRSVACFVTLLDALCKVPSWGCCVSLNCIPSTHISQAPPHPQLRHII
jgi:hypothetical protein